MKAITCSLLVTATLAQLQPPGKFEKFLRVFDYTFDDLVVEQGENWVEKYYVKELTKCDMQLPDGRIIDIKGLAKNAPPDYSFTDDKGFKYFFNVCRNTIMTCAGRDDGIAIQFGTGKLYSMIGFD